jgi:single-strand DNA-binding protein
VEIPTGDDKEDEMEAFVQMTGYVGGDVTMRNAAVPIADFRLASTPRVFRDGGWTDGPTTWITVKAFRGLAQNAATSLRRGDPVIVIGRLRTSTWERDGQSFERLELDASTIGHDLRRGSAHFWKAQRPEPAQQDAESDSSGELEADRDEAETSHVGSDAFDELERTLGATPVG